TDGWQCGYAGVLLASESVTCTIDAFPAGTTDTITVVWQVNPGTTGQSACDQARIESASGNDPLLTTTVALGCPSIQPASYDLSIAKEATPTPTVPAGSDLTYTIAVANSGPSEVTSTTVTDTMPLGSDEYGFNNKVWFESVTPPPGWLCPQHPTLVPGNSGTIVCSTDSFGPGVTETITVNIHV